VIIGTVVSPLGRIGQSILSVRWMLYAVVCAEEAAGGTPGCVAARPWAGRHLKSLRTSRRARR
jgi:hypothetical protein